ncbi:MAG: energy transducer TonB [Rhodothermales bacterium]
MRLHRTYDDTTAYRLRVLCSILASQLVLWALFRFWPAIQPSTDPEALYHTSGQEVIQMEEILPTRQQQRKPPPPPPTIPVVVPDDVVLETELLIEDQMLVLEQYGEDEDAVEGQAGAGPPSFQAPSVGPKPLRFVEPEYTRDARRNRVRAEVVVQVLVDEKGGVREASVLERFLLSGSNDEKQAVPALNYGLEESALAAARRWMFQPARKDGQPVRSYTTLTFRFGV